jgi:perosamine synthetase
MERIGDKELQYLTEVLSGEFRSSRGAQFMKRFEEKFSRTFGVQHSISFCNGTATMHAVLEALGVGPGDEVIVPPLTMSSTAFAVLQANGTPVFADVDYETFQICPVSIAENITGSTKAIITVALYGLSPDMDPIMRLANEHDLFVLEDNAECFLGRYKGKLVGTLGHAASYSFQSSKHLTSGEGGVICTDDDQLALKIRQVQSLGYAGVTAGEPKISKEQIQHPSYSRHVSLGWNYRMPELCCAVALAQVERIEDLVSQRIDAARVFSTAISEFSDWFVPQKVNEDCEHSYWTWVCRNESEVSWEEICNVFRSFGGHGVYGAWKLSYLEPAFQTHNFLGREKFISSNRLNSYAVGLCPIAEQLQPKLFQFKTNYWKLSDAEQQSEILYKTLKHFSG